MESFHFPLLSRRIFNFLVSLLFLCWSWCFCLLHFFKLLLTYICLLALLLFQYAGTFHHLTFVCSCQQPLLSLIHRCLQLRSFLSRLYRFHLRRRFSTTPFLLLRTLPRLHQLPLRRRSCSLFSFVSPSMAPPTTRIFNKDKKKSPTPSLEAEGARWAQYCWLHCWIASFLTGHTFEVL